jgi:predicted nucleotidyltransferase
MDTMEMIRERLERDPRVWFALLFGSRAAGTHRPSSDWDVGVYLDPAMSASEMFDLRLRLADLSDLGEVDVVVLNDAPALLAQRALMGERLSSVTEPRSCATSSACRRWRETKPTGTLFMPANGSVVSRRGALVDRDVFDRRLAKLEALLRNLRGIVASRSWADALTPRRTILC